MNYSPLMARYIAQHPRPSAFAHRGQKPLPAAAPARRIETEAERAERRAAAERHERKIAALLDLPPAEKAARAVAREASYAPLLALLSNPGASAFAHLVPAPAPGRRAHAPAPAPAPRVPPPERPAMTPAAILAAGALSRDPAGVPPVALEINTTASDIVRIADRARSGVGSIVEPAALDPASIAGQIIAAGKKARGEIT